MARQYYGEEPLNNNEDITDLRDWLKQAGVNTIYDLSNWDHRGDWTGWDFHGVPARLSLQQTLLEDLLEEVALVNRSIKDSSVGASPESTPQLQVTEHCRPQETENKHQPSGRMSGIP